MHQDEVLLLTRLEFVKKVTMLKDADDMNQLRTVAKIMGIRGADSVSKKTLVVRLLRSRETAYFGYKWKYAWPVLPTLLLVPFGKYIGVKRKQSLNRRSGRVYRNGLRVH